MSILTFRRLDAVALIFILGGFLGIVIQAYYFRVGGPLWVLPYFLGVWYGMFCFFFGFQMLYLQRKRFDHRREWISDLVYYGIETVIALVLFIGWFVGYRLDGGFWGIALFICLAINVLIVYKSTIVSGELSVNETTDIKVATAGGEEHHRTEREETVWCLFAGFNTFLRVIAFLCLGLLLGGCWTQAVGYRTYPPRGIFIPITYPNGQVSRVMTFCSGPQNVSLPTMFFDVGGGGHSSSDVYTLMFALNAQGRRTCSYDPPGTGWSDYAIPSEPSVLPQTIAGLAALGENGPYILIGFADEAPKRIYEYALQHPTNVRALIPVQYAGNGAEFIVYAQVRNLTDTQRYDYTASTLKSRISLSDLVCAVAVQWGFMPLFTPFGNDTYSQMALLKEQVFLNVWNEKQWTTQAVILNSWATNPNLILSPDPWQSDRTLAANIPVHAFYNQPNTTAQCLSYGGGLDTIECTNIRADAAYALNFSNLMASTTPGGSVQICDNCPGFVLLGNNTPWFINKVLSLVGNITVT